MSSVPYLLHLCLTFMLGWCYHKNVVEIDAHMMAHQCQHLIEGFMNSMKTFTVQIRYNTPGGKIKVHMVGITHDFGGGVIHR